jgi:hypothetical protein
MLPYEPLTNSAVSILKRIRDKTPNKHTGSTPNTNLFDCPPQR